MSRVSSTSQLQKFATSHYYFTPAQTSNAIERTNLSSIRYPFLHFPRVSRVIIFFFSIHYKLLSLQSCRGARTIHPRHVSFEFDKISLYRNMKRDYFDNSIRGILNLAWSRGKCCPERNKIDIKYPRFFLINSVQPARFRCFGLISITKGTFHRLAG